MIEPAYVDGPENAFPTGSHVYGTPREASDVDLVVLLTQGDIALLRDHFCQNPGELHTNDEGSNADDADASLRVGRLNLICFTEEKKFRAWKRGTYALKAICPVSRETAVAVLDAMEKTSA